MAVLSRPKPLVLVILDGFGDREGREANAVRLARTPTFDLLDDRFPRTAIGTSGPDVGLPPGQMGNSEVGHMNFGAGRIAMMDISRIDATVADGSLGKNPVLADTVAEAKRQGGALHLLGLVSAGGVHSSLEHLLALIDLAAGAGVRVWVHAFLDGRDTPPRSAGKYLDAVARALEGKGALATLCGRYYAMDRDKRWERVERAFSAVVHANGPRRATWAEALGASYDAGQGDEFLEPVTLGAYDGVAAGRDAGLFFNFRPDRARELSLALTAEDFSFFPRGEPRRFARYACMTLYDASLGLPVAFPRETYPELFPELLSRAGLAQLRCAETEKYAHVTYFFNGGREAPYDGEERRLIPSPREVATYDQKPQMSAPEVTLAVTEAVRSGRHDFILVNYANPDMVGHTGVLPAAIAAVEAVDTGLGELSRAVLDAHGAMIITADHGNCELMVDPVTGAPHTAHTTNPVPLWLVGEGFSRHGTRLRAGGRICDVAPTLLALLGMEKPAVMTGVSLLGQ
ncbi:MAG: 2,3-bisphosphoglycerate-independent phosphoglycerate mutase [Deltaproteobacteria bacterium]|nr:2,3-bisphosphoglycerate-independent phosphoglycerate mutase [Deltaproteobacteria bacterium]